MKRLLLTLLLLSLFTFHLSPLMAQTYGTQYKGISASHYAGGGVSSSRFISTYDVSGMHSFHSTSAMTLSGSALPMASATGVQFAVVTPSGPLRSGRDDEEGDGDIIDDGSVVHTPDVTPVGDIPWGWILLLAAVYILKKGFSDKSSLTPNSTSIVHGT